ncbi:MAG: DoxX family membrane protein [Deltaproteobacteria bacterium]|nr:DoxX family membrane protein [Deltaproteobacteria bacterium]
MPQIARASLSFWGNLLIRLILAATFVYAAVSKIMDPVSFEASLLTFRLLPLPLVPLMALTLPFVEFWAGLFTLLGPPAFRRAGAFILAALLAVFIVAVTVSHFRGLNFNCGCFGANSLKEPDFLFYARDFILLFLALWAAGLLPRKGALRKKAA